MSVSKLPAWKGVDEPKRLPGPPRLPLVGSALHIGKPNQFYGAMQQWLAQYGDPFYVQVGPHAYVVTANMEVSKTLLDNRPDLVTRPPMIKKSFSSIDLVDNLFSVEGEQWRTQRKVITKGLGAHNLQKAEDVIADEVNRRLDRLQADLRDNTQVDFLPHAKQYSLTVISRLVFGNDFRQVSTQDHLAKDLSLVFNTLARRTVAPFAYWNWVKLPKDKAFERVRETLRGDIAVLADQARAKLAQQPDDYKPETLLEALLQRDPKDEDAPLLNPKEVFANALGLIAAGMDTTSTTLSWAVYLLGLHPHIQSELRQVIHQATGGTGRLPTLQGLQLVPLLEAVIWEALRLYPAAPFLVAHTLQDLEFEGQRLPANCSFFLMHDQAEQQANRRERVFAPHQWLEAGTLPKAIKMLPLPFGQGQRLCPGRNLSVMEMKAYLAALLHRFEWTSTEPAPEQVYNFTFEPENMPVRFVARSV